MDAENRSDIRNVGFTDNPIQMAIVSGVTTLVILGYVSSYITPDDYYSQQLRSLFGDGRFITGFTYRVLKGVFENDANFRLLMCFLTGFTGYFFFNRLAETSGLTGTQSALFGIISVALLGSAYSLFFYDMNMLYYSMAFPVLFLWTIVLDKSLNQESPYGDVTLFILLLGINIVLLSIFQMFAYLIFILLAAMLLVRAPARWQRRSKFCFISAAACVLAIFICSIFTHSDLYHQITGYTLRNRGGIAPRDGLLSMLRSYALSSFDFGIFLRNSVGPHIFLLAFISLKCISANPRLTAWRCAALALLTVTIYFSPFMLTAEMAENPRVLQSLYVYGSIAYFLAAMQLAMVPAHTSVLSNFQAVAAAIGVTLAVAGAFLIQRHHTTPGYQILAALFISLIILIPIIGRIGRNNAMLVVCVATAFFAVDLQVSIKVTDRWNSERVFDRIVIDKLTEAVMDNFNTYGSTKWSVEYGMRKNRLPGTAIQSHLYASEEFWKNSVQSLGHRLIFKRNDELCKESGGGMFKLIESSPETIKFCI